MVEERNFGSRVFDFFNIFLMFLLMVMTFYPIYYVLVASVSHPVQLFASTGLLLWPRGFALYAYEIVLSNPWIWRGYANTVFYVIAGGSLRVFLTLLGGYVLSRRYLPGRNFFLTMIIITMFFSGGLIPTFLVVNAMGLTDTRWAMIFPGAISTFNLIVTKTFLQGIPDELEESGRIDGANDWTILWRIIAPLATPVIAVITLFYVVGIWNSFLTPIIYLRDRDLFPLQVILREILLIGNQDFTNLTVGDAGGRQDFSAYADAVRYATIIVATIPVLCVYPFLQKYFVKGVMLGAIKG